MSRYIFIQLLTQLFNYKNIKTFNKKTQVNNDDSQIIFEYFIDHFQFHIAVTGRSRYNGFLRIEGGIQASPERWFECVPRV